ncbi:hypothetical protein [Mageeibacillus indolicus]|uniref:hypothetical protein n=1 Tax=Mageeibacillus indolicus TaxID=884684 RepID=UPI0012DF138C|nr:hypothetical protein [Mageeibacillus indolicus]
MENFIKKWIGNISLMVSKTEDSAKVSFKVDAGYIPAAVICAVILYFIGKGVYNLIR